MKALTMKPPMASKTAAAPPPVLDGRVATVDALGKIIRNVRKQQGLTQADISGLAATGNRFVVDLEKGKRAAAGRCL
jgi:hypothetical protein